MRWLRAYRRILPVDVLRLILRYAHLIGFALLLGGAIAQYVTGRIRINPAMLWGAVI